MERTFRFKFMIKHIPQELEHLISVELQKKEYDDVISEFKNKKLYLEFFRNGQSMFDIISRTMLFVFYTLKLNFDLIDIIVEEQ